MNTLDLFRHDFVVSIKPEYATKIVDGIKTVELRRRFPYGTVTGARLYVYATAPLQAVIGFATIREVERSPIEQIWTDYQNVAHINRKDFEDYYKDVDAGFVLADPGREIASRPKHRRIRRLATIAVAPRTPMPGMVSTRQLTRWSGIGVIAHLKRQRVRYRPGAIEGGGVYAHGANVTSPRHTRRSGGAPVAATNDEHVRETPETPRVRARVLTAEQRRASVDDINARMAQLKQQWERSGHSFIPSFFEIKELAGA
jgi:predicted transcriptional regulator